MSEVLWLILGCGALGWVCRCFFRALGRRPRTASHPTPQAQAGGQARAVSPVRPGGEETGPMVYYANDPYGQADREYRFNYKKVNGSWRAYILKMPNLGGRESSGTVTHRLFDGGRPYVCWDSAVNSLRDMQAISRVWADCIQVYIATGKRFG